MDAITLIRRTTTMHTTPSIEVNECFGAPVLLRRMRWDSSLTVCIERLLRSGLPWSPLAKCRTARATANGAR